MIDRASEEDFARFYGGLTINSDWRGWAMRKGRLIAGFGGAVEVEPGRWVGFLDVPAHMRRPSLYRAVRGAIAEIRAAGAEVLRVTCEDSIPRSDIFLSRLGFVPTDEELDGKKVWECRDWN